MVHQVGQAHDAQPNAAGIQSGLFQFRHCRHIGVFIHHIVQKTRSDDGGLTQFLPVHFSIGGKVTGKVDRSKAAVLVRSKPLFAARIGRFQVVQMWNRIGAVGGIQEERAWLAVVMCLGNKLVEQIAGFHGLVGAHRQTSALSSFQRA